MFEPLNNEIKRDFVPGDEWLYYKIYCGVKMADRILLEGLKPIIDDLLERKVIDSWFFIRYGDPDNHLRIRFHFTEQNAISEIISAMAELTSYLVNEGLAWNVSLDTYQREVERYGMKTIAQSEELFHHDSTMVLGMLGIIFGDEGEKYRWRFAARAIDQMLNDFGYDLENKHNLLKKLQKNFGLEFGMNSTLRTQISDRYRKMKKELTDALNRSMDEQNIMKPLFELANIKSTQCIQLINSIKEHVVEQEKLDDLLSSYIHMTMNRLFKSKQRLHELILYDFMYSNYRSEKARKEKSIIEEPQKVLT